MYKVLVVDDEPAAVQYVEKLIELKCKDFEVCGTAQSGTEAVRWMEDHIADLIVSDVMMPDMNGIELAEYIQKNDINVVTVIVSGYQDFEYVQGAIRAGVCDYLLKPINPQEIQALFERIKARLDKKYYSRRNQILHQLNVHGEEEIDRRELIRVFPSKRYYAAIIRKNGLLSRFANHVQKEIYSGQNEKVIIYGRDNMEMLYVYPEELIVNNFSCMMKHAFYKQAEEDCYQTMILKKDSFEAVELQSVIETLYRTLDQSIVIGMNQEIVLDKEVLKRKKDYESEKLFQKQTYWARNKEIEKNLEGMEELFAAWERESCPQWRVEEKIRYLFYEMQSVGSLDQYDEYIIDDIFAYVVNMENLCENICEFIRQNLTVNSEKKRQDKEEVYQEVVDYLHFHPAEKLSVEIICKRFGISQATLNRMFRSFSGMSYNSYLTEMKIEISKKMLEEKPDSYIKDIASAVGYNDQFYFSRLFRSVTGMSPTEYLEDKKGKM